LNFFNALILDNFLQSTIKNANLCYFIFIWVIEEKKIKTVVICMCIEKIWGLWGYLRDLAILKNFNRLNSNYFVHQKIWFWSFWKDKNVNFTKKITSDMIPGQKMKLWLIKVENWVFRAIFDPPSDTPSAKSPRKRKLRWGLFFMYFFT
jgi:hypothetical protein